MRKAMLALVMITVSAHPVLADNKPWAEKLFPDGIRHNFGRVPKGTQLCHRFPLTNIFFSDVQIVKTRVSCGCVTVALGAKTVKSGQSSYLDVFVDTRKFTGFRTFRVYVTVGPEQTSTAALKVSAKSRADVTLTPGSVNFGVVAKGQTARQTIDVDYTGTRRWKITGAIESSAPLEITWAKRYRRRGEVGYRVTVALKADAPAGPVHHVLQLRTNDKVSPLLPILVEGTVQAPLTVAPAQITLGALHINELKSQRVVVRGHKPFRIVAIDGLGNGLTVQVPSRTATVHILTIKFQPANKGMVNKPLTIRTNLADDAAATITVEARVDK